MKQFITKEGLVKIKKELEELKNNERKKIASLLKHAISQGDLSENFAYTEAKERQAFLEGRIRVLEEIVRSAVIIQEKVSDKVQVGSTVVFLAGKKKEKFKIVGPAESNPIEGKISSESPLGKALLEKRVGDSVLLETPEGKVKYKVADIQ